VQVLLSTGFRANCFGLALRLAASFGQHASGGAHVDLGRVKQWVTLAVQQAGPCRAFVSGVGVL
jgi:hypothetical protein